ncbi:MULTISPECIES: RDD family protein [unclassified Amycolatopsis]|uniref:RDD family protein n=1 Tax=unclassified Amycolatopsis TaxID=2618356 RepID=UPI0028769533|nr:MULTISPECIES: RDD family protein [unclassified Amycolatopsis]MDS0138956.1 RDD family protein [Amycolatopsis sp. 505]MDS0147628.1 RDD family protein [Amycolatopsis sp. CM201R]
METDPTLDDAPDIPWPVRRRLLRTGPIRRASWSRRLPAVSADLALHLLVAAVAAAGVDPEGGVAFLVTAVVTYLAVSFVHRVLLQRWWGATIGRLLAGLRCADPRTGRPPTLRRLALGWLYGLFATVVAVLP